MLMSHDQGSACRAVMCCVVLCCAGPRFLRSGRLDALLSYDELSQEMQAKRVFQVR